VLHTPGGRLHPLRVRSFVGLIPLLAVHSLEPQQLERCPISAGGWSGSSSTGRKWRRASAPLTKRARTATPAGGRERDKLVRMLERVFDADEFLSDYGCAPSHATTPSTLSWNVDGDQTLHEVRYEPAESTLGPFGGNSNWRGPVWFPINYLLIEALRKYHHHYGDIVHGRGAHGLRQSWLTLARPPTSCRGAWCASSCAMGTQGAETRLRGERSSRTIPHWRDHVLFYEYFHGDTGPGSAPATRPAGRRSSPT
jgi:hypothetical protein